MRRLAWLLGVAALSGCDLVDIASCDYSDSFSDAISATGLTTLIADTQEGDVRIQGRSGINEVRVSARACSDDRRTTDDIDFNLFRANGAARLTTLVPSRDDARLELTIEVPTDFDIDIFDDDGDLEISDVFAVFITDGSGDIDIRDISEDVIIDEDGSGDIDVDDVGGDFIVHIDRSGSIRYRNVRGLVQVP
jgi:hypothetical protein